MMNGFFGNAGVLSKTCTKRFSTRNGCSVSVPDILLIIMLVITFVVIDAILEAVYSNDDWLEETLISASLSSGISFFLGLFIYYVEFYYDTTNKTNNRCKDWCCFSTRLIGLESISAITIFGLSFLADYVGSKYLPKEISPIAESITLVSAKTLMRILAFIFFNNNCFLLKSICRPGYNVVNNMSGAPNSQRCCC